VYAGQSGQVIRPDQATKSLWHLRQVSRGVDAVDANSTKRDMFVIHSKRPKVTKVSSFFMVAA
jgi:hypothetical protein